MLLLNSVNLVFVTSALLWKYGGDFTIGGFKFFLVILKQKSHLFSYWL